MNADEVTALLRRVNGYDNREVTPQATLAWAETLAKVPYDIACHAVREHFSTSDEYLTPGIVLRLSQKIYADQRRALATATRRAADERSEEIRLAALDRKAADAGTRVATPEEAERYGKGLLRAVMQAVAGVVRERNGVVPRGQGVAAAGQALRAYRELHGPAPMVDSRRQPCGNNMCLCTHEEPCSAGWMPVDSADPAAAVAPCPVCKPRAATIADNAKGNRREAQALLREQGKEKVAGRDDPW